MYKKLIPVVICVLSLSACQKQLPYSIDGIAISNTPTKGNTFAAPADGDDIVGQSFVVRSSGDNLKKIGQRYDVGITEMMDANPTIKPYKMLPGTQVVVPAQYVLPPKKYRQGIVINVPELRLYYFAKNGDVTTYPVALGREKWRTPLGRTIVTRKQEAPTWHVPKSIQAEARKNGHELPDSVPPGPNNPLGNYAIYIGIPGYLIHGTNHPNSIGRMVSSGCIRMYNKDVTNLFAKVDKGTPVNIIYYPNKVGWRGNHLYLESHRPISDEKGSYQDMPVDIAISEAASAKPDAHIDWDKVKRALAHHAGAPMPVGNS